LLAAEPVELSADHQSRSVAKHPPPQQQQQQQQPSVLSQAMLDVMCLPGSSAHHVVSGTASSPTTDRAAGGVDGKGQSCRTDRQGQLLSKLQEICRQQQLQLQQQLHGMELLLQFARHCRTAVAQLQPAAVADAAAMAGAPGRDKKGKPGKTRGGDSSAAGAGDVLQVLADAAQDLDDSR
jgi:hypothetical protein